MKMKRQLKASILLSVFAGAMMLGGVAYGETFEYTGDPGDQHLDQAKKEVLPTDGSVSGNQVTVKGVTGKNDEIDYVFGAQGTGPAEVQNNNVTITDNSDIDAQVYGGYMSKNTGQGNADVHDNSVTLDGNSKVTGAATSGEDHAFEGRIMGGYTDGTGDVYNNKVTIRGGSTVTGNDTHPGAEIPDPEHTKHENTGNIYGGYSDSYGDVHDNHVEITDGSVVSNVPVDKPKYGNGAEVYGGFVSNNGASDKLGKAYKNEVLISSGKATTKGNVYGGAATGGGSAEENTVTIEDGGKALNSDSSGDRSVIGGDARGGAGQAYKNGVIIKGDASQVETTVYGGRTGGDGKAGENYVEISGGTVSGASVYGGAATGNGQVDQNRVTVSGGSVTAQIFGGHASGSGAVTGNYVEVYDNGTVNDVTGGETSGSGSVSGNEVYIGKSKDGDHTGGGTVSGKIYGGRSTTQKDGPTEGAAVTNNKVVIDGVTAGIAGEVAGGRAEAGKKADVTFNTVDIINSKVSGANDPLYGGWNGGAGNVTGNTVNIKTGGIVDGKPIYGGRSDGTGSAERNAVVVDADAGAITGNLYGGQSRGGGTVSENHVDIKGSTVTLGLSSGNGVFGGYATGGNVSKNYVAVSGGTVAAHLYGGHGEGAGAVSGNYVEISGSGTAVKRNVFGGDASAAATGAVSGNHVDIQDGTVGTGVSSTEANVAGGQAQGDSLVSGNYVTVSGGTVTAHLYGGLGKGAGDVTGNYVEVSGSGTAIKNNVFGGDASETATGAVSGNHVDIKGGTVDTGAVTAANVFGGHAKGGSLVNGNHVSVSGGTVKAQLAGGNSEGTGDVTGNYVEVYGDSTVSGVTDVVTGGTTSGSGKVSGNYVFIGRDSQGGNTGGTATVTGNVRGGFTRNDGTVENNAVAVTGTGSGTTVTGEVFGGVGWGNGAVTSNRVVIDRDGSGSDAVVKGDVTGGMANGTGAVSGNEVSITKGALVEGLVYGGVAGSSGSGDVKNNGVYIDGGTVKTNKAGDSRYGIFGGRTTVDGAVTGNLVRIVNGSTVDGDVFGGHSDNGAKEVSDNVVLIDGKSTVANTKGDGTVYGGRTNRGDHVQLKNNAVAIRGGSEVGSDAQTVNVYGAYTEKGSGVLSGNSVEVSGTGTIVKGNVTGAYTDGGGEVGGNKVYVEGGSTVNGSVTGGAARGLLQNATVSLNEVHISGSGTKVTGNVTGGEAGVVTIGDATKNKVYIDGGTVTGKVYGAENTSGDLKENAVFLSGHVDGDVIAAAVSRGAVTRAAGDASDNTVTLAGKAWAENADVYGVYYSSTPGAVKLSGTGNKLTLGDEANGVWSGRVNSVNNFNEIEFNRFEWKADQGVEEDEGVLFLTHGRGMTSDLLDTVITAKSIVAQSGTVLHEGDTMTWINTDDDIFAEGVNIDNGKVQTQSLLVGTAIEGTLTHEVEDGDLVLKVKDLHASDQGKPHANARAMAVSFLNEDLINYVLENLSRDHSEGWKTFAMPYGTYNKFDLGDDMTLKGWSFLAGFDDERHIGEDDDELNFTLFFEMGDGRYDITNHIGDTYFRGDGTVKYYGGGIAARYQKQNGVFYEASVRGGKMENKMSNGFMDGYGNSYGYDSDNAYYGYHAAIGRIYNMGEDGAYTLYAKFFHVYAEDDDFVLSNGDDYDIGGITSDRLKVGARIVPKKDQAWRAYYGLAYEYEFNGDVHMRAEGYPVESDDLRGGTGVAEIGVNYKKNPASPWSLDLNMKGYAGMRDGISGHLQATYSF